MAAALGSKKNKAHLFDGVDFLSVGVHATIYEENLALERLREMTENDQNLLKREKEETIAAEEQKWAAKRRASIDEMEKHKVLYLKPGEIEEHQRKEAEEYNKHHHQHAHKADVAKIVNEDDSDDDDDDSQYLSDDGTVKRKKKFVNPVTGREEDVHEDEEADAKVATSHGYGHEAAMKHDHEKAKNNKNKEIGADNKLKAKKI